MLLLDSQRPDYTLLCPFQYLAPINMVGYTKALESIFFTEFWPPFDSTVVTDFDSDFLAVLMACLCTEHFSDFSLLLIQSETSVKLLSDSSDGETLQKLEQQVLEAFATSISFSANIALRANSSEELAIFLLQLR